MKIMEIVLPKATLTKKEAIKMIKKCLCIALTVLTVTLNVVPAQAYTSLQTPVAISATGTLVGTTIAFSATVVAQGTGTPGSAIDFTSPSGVTDSAEAIKVKGGTNQVNSRVIIYTENDLNTVLPNKAATVNPATGVDGAGLVGQTDPAFSVPLFWGTTTGVNNDPNTNSNYVFDGNLNDGIGEVYIVDKRHTASFTTVGSAVDNATLYRFDGTAYTPANVLNDGLYPQLWEIDLYDSASVHTDTTRVSPSLYSTIATVMFGIIVGSGVDATYYIGNVPKISTVSTSDSITARLSKTDNSAGGEMYIAIGGDFTGKPAQVYSTAKLTVAIVQN